MKRLKQIWQVCGFVLAILALGSSHTLSQTVPRNSSVCPEGTFQVGDAPPKGYRLYCKGRDAFGQEILSGPNLLWHKNGQKRQERQYRNGLADGPFIQWFENSQKASDLHYQNGRLEGPAVYWHENGQKAAQGNYRDGLQQGNWLFWKEDGTRTAAEYRDSRTVKVTPPNPGGPHLEVAVDPRVELLAAVQSLTKWPQQGSWSRHGSAYERDLQVAFAPYKDHAAVQQLDALLDKEFDYNAPVGWILHYCSPPELRQCAALDAETLKRGLGQAKLDALAAAFRDFARETKFMDFFKAHEAFYRELITGYRAQAPGDDVLALIERFYGERKAGYSVVIAPMFGGSNYGLRVTESSGERVYNVGAPQFYQQGKYGYDREELVTMIFHEFSHSFTNPAVDSVKEVNKHADWFPALREVMEPQAYGAWDSVVYELMVRSGEIRLLQLYGENSSALDRLGDYANLKGFVWLPYLVERLDEYERNREKYGTFKSFIPRLFAVFDEHEPIIIGGRLRFLVPKLK